MPHSLRMQEKKNAFLIFHRTDQVIKETIISFFFLTNVSRLKYMLQTNIQTTYYKPQDATTDIVLSCSIVHLKKLLSGFKYHALRKFEIKRWMQMDCKKMTLMECAAF